jgi:4-carboxymuconolactone decarboxylase
VLKPRFTGRDQALVYRLVTELIDTKRLGDETFAEAIAAFGEAGVVELGTIIGYYTAIGNALNVFEVAPPAGTAPYFDP